MLREVRTDADSFRQETQKSGPQPNQLPTSPRRKGPEPRLNPSARFSEQIPTVRWSVLTHGHRREQCRLQHQVPALKLWRQLDPDPPAASSTPKHQPHQGGAQNQAEGQVQSPGWAPVRQKSEKDL